MAEAKENQASDDIRIEDTASSDDVDASVVSESTSSEDGDAPVKAKRGRKAKVVSASSIQSDMIEDTGSEAKDATPVPVADKPIETATQAEPEERPAPAPLVASEPVLTSNALENEVQKPKKGGWWQKRGFF
jgi:ribonuclease E